LLDLRGPTSEGKEESGREKESGGGDKKERGGEGNRTPSITNFWLRHWIEVGFENVKHSSSVLSLDFDLVFPVVFNPCGPWGFYLGHVKKFYVMQ